jgi:hypothetical protein
MPGFYSKVPDGIEWKSFSHVRADSIEMSFEEADDLMLRAIPRVRADLAGEGCNDPRIDISQCNPVMGPRYIQVCATGTVSNRPGVG